MKEKLTKVFPTGRASYTDGKEGFVAAVVEMAAREQETMKTPEL